MFGTSLAAHMNTMDRMMQSAMGSHEFKVVEIYLGIRGDDHVTKALNLIRDMLCFNPTERCRISDICFGIEALQGMRNPDTMTVSEVCWRLNILKCLLFSTWKFGAKLRFLSPSYLLHKSEKCYHIIHIIHKQKKTFLNITKIQLTLLWCEFERAF